MSAREFHQRRHPPHPKAPNVLRRQSCSPGSWHCSLSSLRARLEQHLFAFGALDGVPPAVKSHGGSGGQSSVGSAVWAVKCGQGGRCFAVGCSSDCHHGTQGAVLPSPAHTVCCWAFFAWIFPRSSLDVHRLEFKCGEAAVLSSC